MMEGEKHFSELEEEEEGRRRALITMKKLFNCLRIIEIRFDWGMAMIDVSKNNGFIMTSEEEREKDFEGSRRWN